MRKPTKTVIYLNTAATVLYAVAAFAYFMAGRNGFGWLWVALTVLWIGTTALSVRTYRTQCRTYEMTQKTAATRARWSS